VSLDIARLIAFSGLAATELQVSVTAANLANAGTAGYTQKNANQESVATGGIGAGVTITGISSNVDKLLLKSLIGATSDLGSADVTNSYMSELQQLFGTASSSGSGTKGTSLANSLASLESALSSLAATPGSVSLQAAAISALDDVATQLRQTSSGIQNLRANADQDISSSVGSINKDLQQIADLNKEIKQGAASGQSTADLEDQRNSALQDLSSFMNVSYYTNSSGDLQVFTASGQALVDSSAHTLSYTPASSVSASTTYSPGGTGGFSAITVNGADITSQITSGKISALVTLRDKTLPASQSQLDQLAQQLKSSLNAVSNQGTALPPPAGLTGSASVPDALSATGTVRIAVVGQSGNVVSYQDVDLSRFTSVTALAQALSNTDVTASVDSSGHLTLKANTSGDGISINEMTSSIGGANAPGFSDYFGLNDLATGTGASDFAVRGDILDGSAALPISTLDSSATLTVGNQVLSPGSATVANAFEATLTGSTNFAAAGGLNATKGSFADYAAGIVSNVATKASQASGVFTSKLTAQQAYAGSLSAESGVNVDEETNRSAALQNQYAAVSQLISTINTMFTSLIAAMQAG
jgi:flagellar hook-associated protein 1 FlgK